VHFAATGHHGIGGQCSRPVSASGSNPPPRRIAASLRYPHISQSSTCPPQRRPLTVKTWARSHPTETDLGAVLFGGEAAVCCFGFRR
jgi:hypothetical protein